MSDHWLDRFADSQTRALLLKRLAAGAALTVPFARALEAHAAVDNGCAIGTAPPADVREKAFRNGCKDAADRAYTKAIVGCNRFNPGIAGGTVNFAAAVFMFPLLGGAGTVINAIGTKAGGVIGGQACADGAVLRRNATKWGCANDATPSYDPCSTGGPCDTCPGTCCPDPGVFGGFACCTPGPEGCCKANGCTSGTSVCSSP